MAAFLNTCALQLQMNWTKVENERNRSHIKCLNRWPAHQCQTAQLFGRYVCKAELQHCLRGFLCLACTRVSEHMEL